MAAKYVEKLLDTGMLACAAEPRKSEETKEAKPKEKEKGKKEKEVAKKAEKKKEKEPKEKKENAKEAKSKKEDHGKGLNFAFCRITVQSMHDDAPMLQAGPAKAERLQNPSGKGHQTARPTLGSGTDLVASIIAF